MAGQRQAQKEATRAKVLAAARALFAEHGYEATTIRDIARAAGMSTGAVFVSWSGKDALYRELYGHAPVPPELGAGLLNVVRRALAANAVPFDHEMAAGLVAQIDEA